MQLVDDKSRVRSKSLTSPPRRKIPVKKTVEEEAAEAILAELKEVFIKDIRSRIVNPMILDFLDPSHYNDAHPKTESIETAQRPDARVSIVSPVKEETAPLNLRSITNRIPLLPRFRKKGVGAVREDSIRDRKPTKADVRPMHHQFNYYSDSEDEDEDELPHREATVVSDDEDESSRPSRETTSVSTPEPSRIKSLGRIPIKTKDISVKEDVESEEDLMKDILESTKDGVSITVTKRKRVIDFTSSEDEDEPLPSKKVCVETEPLDEIKVDGPAPKLSKVTTLKTAKAEAAALRRTKKADTLSKEAEDSITVETISEKEVKAQVPAIPKIPEVDLSEIEDDDDILLDLDGVQMLVRDAEDYQYLLEALAGDTSESIHDIWTWSWRHKKLKALNFDGAQGIFPFFLTSLLGPMKKPEPPAYNRINPNGCARSERYVKIANAEKSLYLPQRNKAIVPVASETARKTSRMNRVNNRRLAADMEVQKKTLATESDILRFNQLKARKKQLKFARSPIHDWGLFAMEDIEAHEMVIEYVGEIVRFQVAELREKQYERVGIGSSYLFRVDDENIIDGINSLKVKLMVSYEVW
jgi:[histone H3]-lysine4 N-trimethyltransferase SETD1